MSGSTRNGRRGTRDSILEAAADLFSRQEYSAVSMDDLAGAASVAKGTLYHHFGSKESLFLSLIGERSERMLDLLQRIVDGEDEAESKLRSLTIHTFMFFVKYPAFHRLWEKGLASEPCPRTAPISEIRDRLCAQIQRVLLEGMTAGALRPVSPDTAADFLLGAVHGALPRCEGLGIDDPAVLRQREELFDFVWEALRDRSRMATSSPAPTARRDLDAVGR